MELIDVNLTYPVVTSHPLVSGLTAWWRCVPNGTYTTTLTDFIGSKTLTVAGNAGIGLSGVTTPASKVLYFSDSPPVGYADAADAAAWDINAATGEFTLSAFVYFWDLTPGFFLQHWTGAYDNWYWYYASGNMILTPSRVNSSDTSGLGWAWSPSINTWYHVAVTKSGTNYTAYVNGAQQGSTQSASWAWNTKAGVLRVGAFDGTSGYDFSGGLDNIKIYNRALSGSEVSSLYTEDYNNNPYMLNWHRGYTASGGFSFGGSAPVDHSKKFVSSGGFTLGGSAPSTHQKDFASTGGFSLGGSSSSSYSVNHEAAGEGGFTLGGSAESSHSVNHEFEPSGGFTLTASSSVAVQYFYEHTTDVTGSYWARLSFGGGAEHSATYDYTHQGTGGFTLEAESEVVQSVNHEYEPSGGFALDGTAETSYQPHFVKEMSGGLHFAGSATTSYTKDFLQTMNGGFTLSGTAIVSHTYNEDPSDLKEIDVNIRTFLMEKLTEEYPDIDWTEYGRLYEGLDIEEGPLPRIWYRRSGEEDMGNFTGVTRSRFDFELYSEDIAEAQEMAQKIKGFFHGYTGPMDSSDVMFTKVNDHDDEYQSKGNGTAEQLTLAAIYVEIIHA